MSTLRVIRYSKEVKFFLGDKYPVNEFKVKLFEFALCAHKFDFLKIIFPMNII